MKAVFHLKRKEYYPYCTIGEILTPDGKHFGHTLEDTVRPRGIKVKGHTAIPETEGDQLYILDIRQSPKYGEVVVIYTRKEGANYILENGIKFEMILVHGGNDENDTEGCVLVAKTKLGIKIQGSLKKEFVQVVKNFKEKGYQTFLRITNLV